MATLNTPLNDPIPPDLDNPAPHGPLAGDHTDDDGWALDEHFEPADQSPIDWGVKPTPTVTELPSPTRIVTRTFLVTPDGTNLPQPVMVLPRDLNRVKLYLICTALAGFQFGSEKSDVYGAPTMPDNAATTGLDLSGHTGALWVYTPTIDAAKPLTIRVWAVTS